LLCVIKIKKEKGNKQKKQTQSNKKREKKIVVFIQKPKQKVAKSFFHAKKMGLKVFSLL
jgi:hypothetical protein